MAELSELSVMKEAYKYLEFGINRINSSLDLRMIRANALYWLCKSHPNEFVRNVILPLEDPDSDDDEAVMFALFVWEMRLLDLKQAIARNEDRV